MRSRSGYTFHFSGSAVSQLVRQLDTLAKPTPQPARPRTASIPIITDFYDSDHGTLLKAGWLAQANRHDAVHVYTLSRCRTSGAALQTWRSWAGAAHADTPSDAAFAGLPDLPGKIQRILTQHAALTLRLSTDIQRSSWQLPSLDHPDIEVLLEIGYLAIAGQRQDIAELTLSSSRADAGPALLTLARQLHQTTPLFLLPEPAVRTALRRLFDTTASPIKYAAPHATRHPTSANLCLANLTAIVEHWLSNQAGVREHSDIEYVHQLRVALRRLNAACKLFAPWLDPAWHDHLAPELRWLRGLLGHTRDWDVFIDVTLPALCAATTCHPETSGEFAQARQLRDEARVTLQTAMKSTRYATLVLDVVQWLALVSQQQTIDGRQSSSRKHAKKWLRKNHLIGTSIPHFSQLPEAEQHRIRLRAKRLRYTIEFLAPLLSPKSCKSASRSYAAMLDALGTANDAAVAAQLIKRLTLNTETRAYANGWLAARRQYCVGVVERQLPHLRKPKLA